MRRWLVSILPLAIALPLAGYVWHRVLALELPSAIHWVEWRDSAGRPVEPCSHARMIALVDDARIFIACGGTYADIDFSAATAQVWPGYRTPFDQRTVALARGPHGEIAVAWARWPDQSIEARIDGGRTAILGPGDVLASTWVDGAFEIVQSWDPRRVTIVRFDGTTSIRRARPLCEYCVATGAYHTADRGWVIFAADGGRPEATLLIPERGPAEWIDERPASSHQLDRSAVGSLEWEPRNGLALGHDGRIHRPDPPPAPRFERSDPPIRHLVGDKLELEGRWLGPEWVSAQQTPAGTRYTKWLADGVLVGSAPYLFRAFVARRGCVPETWIPARDGWILASDDGCYTTFDASLQPREQMSLFDYVATRLSYDGDTAPPGSTWWLGFLLFGLPGSVLTFVALALLARTRVGTAIVLGSAIYAAAAPWLLRGVLPFLA